MREANYTPGPWEADCRTGCFAVRRKGDNLNCMSEASRDSIVFQNGRSEELSEPNGYRYLTDEQIANANLIAAAPEMLELLEDIEKELRFARLDQRENNAHDVSSLPAKLCIRLHEAIQKARGQG